MLVPRPISKRLKAAVNLKWGIVGLHSLKEDGGTVQAILFATKKLQCVIQPDCGTG